MSRPSYVERPIGNSISFWPTAPLMPGNAQVGQGAPPAASNPESRPLAAKSEILAALGTYMANAGSFGPSGSCGQRAIAALIEPTPQKPRVVLMAPVALPWLKNRASPTLLVSIPSKVWVPT